MKKKTRVDTDITLVFMKRFSDKIVQLLVKTPITPVQISVISFLVTAPLVTYLFIIGSWTANIIALTILIIHSFLDLMDGELARQKKMSSRLGIWLEVSLDPLMQTIVILSISLNILLNVQSNFKYLIFLVLFGQAFANILGTMLQTKFKIDPLTGNRIFNNAVGESRHSFDFVLKNIVVPSHPVFVLFFTLRFFVIIGIIINRLPLTFILFGFFIVIRAFVLFTVLTIHYTDHPINRRLAIFKYLTQAEDKIL